MKTYKVSWTDLVGMYMLIEATSKEEALEKFWSGDKTGHAPEPCGFCEVETDSVEVEEEPPPPQRCESGWTGDRCNLPLGHEGPHSN